MKVRTFIFELLFVLFFCSSFHTSQNGCIPQLDCKDVILVNETNDTGIQFLKTKALPLVKRGNYTYKLELINDSRGIGAKMYSLNGVRFNKADQIIFMDESKKRFAYGFIEKGTNLSKEGKTVYSNHLQFDQGTIEWLTSSNITTLYIKDNQKNEMRKFTISEDRRLNLRALANCFYLKLTKEY